MWNVLDALRILKVLEFLGISYEDDLYIEEV